MLLRLTVVTYSLWRVFTRPNSRGYPGQIGSLWQSLVAEVRLRAHVSLFAGVTLAPAVLLGFSALYGGVWIYAALVYLTLFAFAVDELAMFSVNPGEPDAEFPAANLLSMTLAVVHFPLMIAAIWIVSGASGSGGGERIAAFFAFGLFFGQVSNSNAHELIHRPERPLFNLGKWVFISHLFGHHTSAHRLVHHRFVATENDPNSAPLGMDFYRFAARAWLGSFRLGFLTETRLRGVDATGLNPYFTYISGGLLMLGISMLVAGIAGLVAYLGLAGYATMQILLSDYVQHYGLRRKVAANGQPEPVGDKHSWNSRHRFSSLLMLNAPRHSDHHGHPAKPFPALQAVDQSPELPHSLAVMGMIALVPWRWRRIMNARVRALHEL